MLYVGAGVLSSAGIQIPLWAVRNVHVVQSVIQKARVVGDVVVDVEQSEYTGRGNIRLESVEEPHRVWELIDQLASEAQERHGDLSKTVYYRSNEREQIAANPEGMGLATRGVVAPKSGEVSVQPMSTVDNLADQLTRLGELRDKGLLTDEEFAAQKAKLLAEHR